MESVSPFTLMIWKKLILYHSLETDQIEREFDEHIGLHRKNV